jgi:hypothetical protein
MVSIAIAVACAQAIFPHEAASIRASEAFNAPLRLIQQARNGHADNQVCSVRAAS